MTAPNRHPPGPYALLGTYLHLEDGGAITPLRVTPTFWQELGSGALGGVGEGGVLQGRDSGGVDGLGQLGGP